MKFLVFIKQVPLSTEIRFDNARKTLVREGVKSEMNAYDRRAITEAIRYRNENGGEVIAVTMGPPQAADALREASIMGVDRCIHIEDRNLAGSDTLITSHVLAAAAKRIGYDLIFCGQHSTDSETGQVPVQLAEMLDLPCATAVRKIEYLPNRTIQITSETDEGSMLLEMTLPAVLSAAERLIKPLKTKNADLTVVPDDKIHRMGLDDLELSKDQVGVDASPTWVSQIQDVQVHRTPEMWDGGDVHAVAKRILNFIQSHRQRSQPAGIQQRNIRLAGQRSIWCWIEFLQNEIRPVSLEILSAAAELGSVAAILPYGVPADIQRILAEHGANQIFYISRSNVHPDEMISTLCDRISVEKPHALYFPSTPGGRYIASRIAARLSLGLVGDCVGLRVMDGEIAYIKPAFGGNIEAPIFCRTKPELATVRPGALEIAPAQHSGDVEVQPWHVPEGVSKRFTIVAQEIDPGIEATKLDNADVVIGVGAGLGQENLRLAQRLAELLDSGVAATRRVVDSGWMPRQFQVGLTGKFIAPQVYLALGASGRYNHMIGVQKSNHIIAINQDPAAEVFAACDIAVHGDCAAIAAEIIRLLEHP